MLSQKKDFLRTWSLHEVLDRRAAGFPGRDEKDIGERPGDGLGPTEKEKDGAGGGTANRQSPLSTSVIQNSAIAGWIPGSHG